MVICIRLNTFLKLFCYLFISRYYASYLGHTLPPIFVPFSTSVVNIKHIRPRRMFMRSITSNMKYRVIFLFNLSVRTLFNEVKTAFLNNLSCPDYSVQPLGPIKYDYRATCLFCSKNTIRVRHRLGRRRYRILVKRYQTTCRPRGDPPGQDFLLYIGKFTAVIRRCWFHTVLTVDVFPH